MARGSTANTQPDERNALRAVLLDLKMEIVAGTADWSTTPAKAPKTGLDMRR